MSVLVRTRITSLLAAGVTALAACADPSRSVSPDGAALAKGGAEPSAASAGVTAYVVHGINGKDLGLAEALPVDVQINGACALTGFTFRSIVGPVTLAAGPTTINVRLANPAAPCTGAVAATLSAPLPAGANLTVVAHLTAAGAPTLTPFANDFSRAPGRTRLFARHAAAFGPVDLLLDGSVAAGGLTNGNQVVAEVNPGRTNLALTPAGSSTRVWELDTVLRPFTAVIAYAVGTPAKGTFEVLTQVVEIPKRP